MAIARGSKVRPTVKRFVIPSDLRHGAPVERAILAEARKRGYNAHSLFAIKLALDEALVNAIRHGNKRDASKHVRIVASITPTRTEIIVEDEGCGFRRGCVPDPTEEENLHRPCGRGILLMESYMNQVQWSRGGRRVKMV
jgi:serine/threonine-protein kinase RsbW